MQAGSPHVRRRAEARNLDQRFIERLTPADKPYVVRDTKIRGLMIAVNKTGISFKVQRDLYQGERGRRRLVKTVRHTLGDAEVIPLDDARTRAMEIIAQIKRGVDPNAREDADGAGAEGWSVARMFDEYAADLRKRECRERTIEDTIYRRDLYLKRWLGTPIADFRRSAAREEHMRVTREHGKRVANQVMKDFRAAYNLALRIVDDPDALPDNPTKAITWNKERASNRVLMPDDLPEWWEKVQALPNPLRRAMHELGLLSGLRPGTLVSLRREWVHLDDRCISIPRMKSGRAFDLPLSAHMIEVVQRALTVGDVMYRRSEWLFPTRGRASGDVIATQTWREKTLPSETGHILRHTYRTIAKREGVDQIDARLLLDHRVPGIDGVYVHARALFDRLLGAQERMSAAVVDLVCLRRAPVPTPHR